MSRLSQSRQRIHFRNISDLHFQALHLRECLLKTQICNRSVCIDVYNDGNEHDNINLTRYIGRKWQIRRHLYSPNLWRECRYSAGVCSSLAYVLWFFSSACSLTAIFSLSEPLKTCSLSYSVSLSLKSARNSTFPGRLQIRAESKQTRPVALAVVQRATLTCTVYRQPDCAVTC